MLQPEQVDRILIIRLAPLGETVLTTPVIRALRQHFRDAYIAYMVAPTREDLVSANPHLDEVITYQASSTEVNSSTRFSVNSKWRLCYNRRFAWYFTHFLRGSRSVLDLKRTPAGKKLLSLAVPNNTAQHETQRYLDVVRDNGH